MKHKIISVFFDALCAAFPASDIVITTKNSNVVLFSRKNLELLPKALPEELSVSERNSPSCHFLSLSLPEEHSLFLCVSKAAHPLREGVLSIVLALEQMIFLSGSRQEQPPAQDKPALFLKHLLQGQVVDEPSLLSTLAEDLQIDLTLPRVVCLLRLEDMQQTSIARDLLGNFRQTHPNDIIGTDENGQILLCRWLSRNTHCIKAQCHSFFLQLHGYLSEHLAGQVVLGIGSAVLEPSQYSHSYALAHFALQYASAEEPIVYAVDHIPEIIFENTPSEVLKHFLAEYAERLTENPLLYQTIEALVQHDMNMAETAKSLYIHKNTMLFRMKQIKELLQLDPIRSDHDRYTLHLIYRYHQWESRLQERKPQP